MEIWKDILDFPGYQVSNAGRVRSFINFKGQTTEQPHVLKLLINNKTGYVFVHLIRDKYSYNRYVHRLVAEVFCYKKHGCEEINHIDGDKLNNNYTNLEWCTRSENIKHVYSTGLKTPARANRIPIRVIETNEIFDSITDCSKVVGNNRTKISQCLNDNHNRVSYNGYHFEYIDK